MCVLAVLGSQGIVVKCTAVIFFRTVYLVFYVTVPGSVSKKEKKKEKKRNSKHYCSLVPTLFKTICSVKDKKTGQNMQRYFCRALKQLPIII